MADAEKKPLSIAETIEAYAGGEKFPKRKITEEEKRDSFLRRTKEKGLRRKEVENLYYAYRPEMIQ